MHTNFFAIVVYHVVVFVVVDFKTTKIKNCFSKLFKQYLILIFSTHIYIFTFRKTSTMTIKNFERKKN